MIDQKIKDLNKELSENGCLLDFLTQVESSIKYKEIKEHNRNIIEIKRLAKLYDIKCQAINDLKMKDLPENYR